MIFCGRCGCVLTAERIIKPSGKQYVYYRCHGKLHEGPCGEKRIPETVLDKHLLNALRGLSISPRAAAWIEKTAGPSLMTRTDQVKNAREALRRALLAASHEGDELLNLRLAGQGRKAAIRSEETVRDSRERIFSSHVVGHIGLELEN